MIRPNVQSMAALAIVTALMVHLKKGGELSSADTESVLDRASPLLKVFNLSFDDVTKADEVFATVRDTSNRLHSVSPRRLIAGAGG